MQPVTRQAGAAAAQTDDACRHEARLADIGVDQIEEMAGLRFEDGCMNAGYACCDRWTCVDRPAVATASVESPPRTYSYDWLARQSNRLANYFVATGVHIGDTICVVLDHSPARLLVALATWKVGAVFLPLPSDLPPDQLQLRLRSSSMPPTMIVGGLQAIRACQVTHPHALTLCHEEGWPGEGPGTLLHALGSGPASFSPVHLPASAEFVRLFTSGTTGVPKEVTWRLESLYQIYCFALHGLDIREDERVWCVADPTSSMHLRGGVIAPMLRGACAVLHAEAFGLTSAMAVLSKCDVSHLIASPTAFRLLSKSRNPSLVNFLRSVPRLTSGGEPSDVALVDWAARVLSARIHNIFGQTETGVILCQHRGSDAEYLPGSLGRPCAGFSLAVLDGEGHARGAGHAGMLAVDRARSPLLFFAGYSNGAGAEPDARWYMTGDVVRHDADGNFFHLGRRDDLILSSGRSLSPAVIEDLMRSHRSVLDVAVVGRPDVLRTEVPVAFVVAAEAAGAGRSLALEIQRHVRRRAPPYLCPRQIDFVAELPRTNSGKLRRDVLRSRVRGS